MNDQQVKPNVYCRNWRCGHPLAKCVHAWLDGMEGMDYPQATYWVKTYDGSMVWEFPDGTKQKSIWPPAGVDSVIARLFRWNTRYKAATPGHRPLPDTPLNREVQERRDRIRESAHIDHPLMLDDEAAQQLLPPDTPFRHIAANDPALLREVHWHVTVGHDGDWAPKHAAITYGMIFLDHGQLVRCPKCRMVQPLEWVER